MLSQPHGSPPRHLRVAFPIVIEIAFVTVSDAMKEKRHRLNLTQWELAHELEVSQTTIYAWEARKRFPRATELRRVADWLGIDRRLLRL